MSCAIRTTHPKLSCERFADHQSMQTEPTLRLATVAFIFLLVSWSSDCCSAWSQLGLNAGNRTHRNVKYVTAKAETNKSKQAAGSCCCLFEALKDDAPQNQRRCDDEEDADDGENNTHDASGKTALNSDCHGHMIHGHSDEFDAGTRWTITHQTLK